MINKVITLKRVLKDFPTDLVTKKQREILLQNKHWEMTTDYAKKEIKTLSNLTHKILDNIPSKVFNTQLPNMPHPLSFELGHTTLFYENFINRFLNNTSPINPDNNIFDSIYNLPDERKHLSFPSLENQKRYYDSITYQILDNLPETKLNPIASYLLNQCFLHHHMHLEVYLFLLNQLRFTSNLGYPFISYEKAIPLEFINIKGGKFFQGKKENEDFFWDNETPPFTVNIDDFKVSKYPITNSQYLDFINSNGYQNKKYWSEEGWRWKTKNNISLPLTYFHENNQFYRNVFDQTRKLELDYPVCHVSYWEAEAFANFHNARLPTESEMEYLMTNNNQTKYPWSDDERKINNNYGGDICSVLEYKDENKDGVCGLMGNVWQWTKTPFHPYPKYQIDPTYERFSYPFFFFRNIVKGSSWCAPYSVAYPKYRNSQPKEARFHYIGIRLVK